MFILLNDKSPLAIIRFFVENKGDFHVREVARRTTLSVGFVSRVLHELHKEGLFSAQKKGKMIFYSIELDNPIIKQIKTLFTVMKIYPLIEKINAMSRRIILFGSCARGENLPDSDIDLFVLTSQNEPVRKILAKNSRISPIIMDSVEFTNFKKKDPSLFEQIIGGIALWEVKDYEQ